jgi:hypothetical protein
MPLQANLGGHGDLKKRYKPYKPYKPYRESLRKDYRVYMVYILEPVYMDHMIYMDF